MAQKDKLGKVLIVAGSADAMMNYEMQLAAYTTDTALTAESAVDRIDDLEPDVIIIDEKLPGYSGIELAQWIRNDQASPHYFSILIVANGKSRNLDDLVAQSNADSACLFEHTKHDLAARINLLMRYKKLQDKSNSLSLKLTHSKETIRDLEDQDSITRLYNISYMSARLDKELRHADRFSAPLSYMLISILGFEEISRERGSAYAVKVLQQFGNELLHLTRADDVVGRGWGGQFQLLLPETPEDGTDQLLRRIQKHMDNQSFGLDEDKIKLELVYAVSTVKGDGQGRLTAKAIVRETEDLLLEANQKPRLKIAD